MTKRDRRPYRMVARAEQVEHTRRATLDAMKAACRTAPYPEIRVADVAASAGVSAQTVHAHFRTKDDLLLAAIAELGPEVLAMRGTPVPGDTSAIVRGTLRAKRATSPTSARTRAATTGPTPGSSISVEPRAITIALSSSSGL